MGREERRGEGLISSGWVLGSGWVGGVGGKERREKRRRRGSFFWQLNFPHEGMSREKEWNQLCPPPPPPSAGVNRMTSSLSTSRTYHYVKEYSAQYYVVQYCTVCMSTTLLPSFVRTYVHTMGSLRRSLARFSEGWTEWRGHNPLIWLAGPGLVTTAKYGQKRGPNASLSVCGGWLAA